MDDAQKIEFVTRMGMAYLDDLAGALRLYFTLGAGAFVLFTNLLAQTRPTRLESWLLFSSIIAFGLMAVCSLALVLKFARFRSNFMEGIMKSTPVDDMRATMGRWAKNAMLSGHFLDWLFRLGIGLAATYALVLLLSPR